MPWFIPWSENIKKRACRYLLQRYLGQFLEEKLTLDQLSVDLYNGTGTVCNVSLDCESLNELGEAQGWPVEFVDGFVQQVDVSVPWANMLKEDSFVQITGLTITIQPRQRMQSGTGMFESMWSSMTSSMQLATECLQQHQEEDDEGPAPPQAVEGIELFAQTIDSVLCRVKVRFSNTIIRMEHVPKDSPSGVALEIHIKNIDYLDEAGSDPPAQITEADKNKTYVVSTFTTKKICFDGVTFHTDEFPSKARTFSKSILVESMQASSIKVDPDLVLSNLCKSSDAVESLYESCTYSSLLTTDKSEPLTSTPKVTSPEPPNLSNVCTEPEPIIFGRLAGRQEMRIRIKQSEEAVGPKVDFQLTLGSLTMFLSPRQFHILMELAEGLASPHLEDNSNMPSRGRGLESKPMRAMDFERVEAQLAGEMQTLGNVTHNILNTHGWSSNNMGDSMGDDDDKFLPLRNDPPPQADSLSSSLTSSIISNASSLPSLASTNTHQRRKRGSCSIPDSDLQTEISQVHIRVASVACVLLHEDILTLSASSNGECLAKSSVKQMKSVAEDFFNKLGLFSVSGSGARDLDEASKAFNEAVNSNHLRLILAPLIVEGGERCNGSGSCLSVQLTAARLLLHECLREDASMPPPSTTNKFTCVPLLTFSAQDSDGSQTGSHLNPLCKTPDLKAYYKSTQRTSRSGGDRRLSSPKTDININLEPCIVEVDISLVDRMCALLNPQPLCKRQDASLGPDRHGTVLQEQQSAPGNQYQIRVMCPRVTIRLRFPIADLRPAHDMSRPAWWQRCVRKEMLVGHLLQTTLTLQPSSFNIRCREMNLYFSTEGCSESDIHLGSAVADEDPTYSDGSYLPTLEWPSLSIRWSDNERTPLDSLDSCSEGEGDPAAGIMGQSSAMLMETLRQRPGPFSSKKMVHESDTPHPKDDDEDETEELVIPGDMEEMKNFVDYSLKNSLLQIQCTLPVVSLQLDGKQLYELIYNRINSDLFLWEPCAPRSPVQPPTPHMGHPSQSHFSACKSAINYNSDSDSSASSSTESHNLYYSVYDQKVRQQQKVKAKRTNTNNGERVGRVNATCFHLVIGKGLLTMHTPVRDSNNLVIPGQRGEICVRVGGLTLCHVAGVSGNPRRALLSLQATNAHLYHAGVVSALDGPSPLRLYSNPLPPYLRLTIQPSEKGIQLKQAASFRDQLSIAISIKPHKDYHNFKSIRVAVGVSNSTLDFTVCPSQDSVLNQCIDMFDVLDYPVAGYEPSTVVTELHVHVWDSAVDYRPLHLPLRTVATLGTFSVSSNVVAQSNASNLRFMAEECMLFLAEGSSTRPANLRKEYVQVLDIGLFELSLRVNDKQNISTAPRMDLRASNNVVHLRTCSDTFSALCKFINYLASDGDLLDQHADSTQSIGEQSGENILIGDDSSSSIQQEDIRELSQSQVQQVNDLMADAMEEKPKVDDTTLEEDIDIAREGVEVFFFPDESKAAKLEREASSLTQVSINSSSTDLTGNNFADCEPTSGEFLCDDGAGSLKQEGRVRLVSFGEEMGPPIPVVARELGDYSTKLEDVGTNVKRESPKQTAHSDFALERKSSGDTDDEFCMLGDEILAAGKGLSEPQVKWLIDGPPHVFDNHFTVPQGKSDILKTPKNFPMALFRYTLREMTIIWYIYGGKDFPTPAAQAPQKRDDQRSASLGPSIKHVTINTPSPTFAHRDRDPYSIIPPSSSSWGNSVSYSKMGMADMKTTGGGNAGNSNRGKGWVKMGGAGRRHDVLMELQLNKVRFLHETYPPGHSESSRQVLVISSVEVRDRLASSQINKFLYQYTSEQRPKRKHSNMVVIKAVHVRPEGSSSPPECCLKVSLLPLRFNIDQDALLFLISFFTQLSDVDQTKEGNLSSTQSGSSQSLHSLGGGSPRHYPAPPIMGVAPRDNDSDAEDSLSLKDDEEGNPLMRSYEAEKLVSENLILLEEDCKGGVPSRKGSMQSHRGSQGSTTASQPSSTPEPDDAPVYFRNIVFSPEVPIRLDYQGKRVDLTHGPLAGLLMGLAQLNCSELKLKRLSYRHGILGFEKLVRWALQEWLGDIKRRQLPGLLGGVGPMHSLLQLFQGIRDLFWLPIEQYQRDGRLVRGLQRGASSFTTSTAMAALDITARIVYLIQATAETAYDMVSPSPGLRSVRRRRRRERGQPQDIREGVSTAYNIVKEGLNETAMALAEVAVSERAVRGYSGAVGGVLRQLPPTALAPLLLASAAASRLLGGVKASLQPPHHQEHSDKWRTGGNND